MSSRKRLTWRTVREASDSPFLCASSSSSTTIGRYTSCSSKRKIAVGSCISTLVSSTNSRRPSRGRVHSRGSVVVPVEGPESERLRRFKNFLRVAGHLHLAPLTPQHACGVDQKCTALDSQILPAIKTLLLDDIERL